jgi:hypothetical protein
MTRRQELLPDGSYRSVLIRPGPARSSARPSSRPPGPGRTRTRTGPCPPGSSSTRSLTGKATGRTPGAAVAVPGPGGTGTAGYLLTHYAISPLICTAATSAGIDPDRVKFKRAVPVIRRVADPAFPPDDRDRAMTTVMADITDHRNLNQRRDRTYPRVI